MKKLFSSLEGKPPLISEKAVRGNQIRIMRKLNAGSMTPVLDYAFKKGLINLYELLELRFSKKKLDTNGWQS